jgi:alpha-tubulin suppressor-like RCC1 family protein
MVFLTKFEKQALSKVSFAKNAAGKIAVLQAKFGTKLLLFAWGNNATGQLGLGGESATNSPIQVGTTSWTTVNAGGEHTVGIRSDGLLFTWGNNPDGRLGDGTTTPQSSPIQIGSSSWTAAAAGSSHTAAIRSDGLLFTWGTDNFGQLGQGNRANRSSPVQIGSSSWTSVAAGGRVFSQGNTLAIRSDGLLFGWGSGGGAGDGTTADRSSPVQIGSSSWTMVSISSARLAAHVIAIRSDNLLFAWGSNGTGQLGDETITARSSPVQVGSSSWIAASAGEGNSVAIRSDGLLFSWGFGGNGRVGDGTLVSKSSPVQIGSSSWTAVSGGQYVSHAIRSDGLLFGWGRGYESTVGDSTNTTRSSPVQIGSSSWTSISGGGGGYTAISSATPNHAAAIRSDGALFAFGRNLSYGRLGLGAGFINELFPVQLDGNAWKMISAGRGNDSRGYDNPVAAIRNDGLLFTWGNNNTGQLGDGTTTQRNSPVQIGSSSWSMVSTGTYHTAAIRSDGALFTWGSGGDGRLGDGTNVSKSSPVQIGSSSWTSVSAGGSHTTAIRSDGALFTWGLNSSGQLGQGNTTARNSPVQVGSSSWSMVSAGNIHTAAITTDNLLFTWGSNGTGRLGHGDTAPRSSPVQVGSSSWSMVSTNGHAFGARGNTAAIRSDGLLFTWGNNYRSELGNGTGGATTAQSSPVQIGSSSWTVVSVGVQNCAAIRSDGLLFAWGRGRIGDGSFGANSPVQIGTNSWAAISAGNINTLGLLSQLELLPP